MNLNFFTLTFPNKVHYETTSKRPKSFSLLSSRTELCKPSPGFAHSACGSLRPGPVLPRETSTRGPRPFLGMQVPDGAARTLSCPWCLHGHHHLFESGSFPSAYNHSEVRAAFRRVCCAWSLCSPGHSSPPHPPSSPAKPGSRSSAQPTVRAAQGYLLVLLRASGLPNSSRWFSVHLPGAPPPVCVVQGGTWASWALIALLSQTPGFEYDPNA